MNWQMTNNENQSTAIQELKSNLIKIKKAKHNIKIK
jgi:hypothetical protein